MKCHTFCFKATFSNLSQVKFCAGYKFPTHILLFIGYCFLQVTTSPSIMSGFLPPINLRRLFGKSQYSGETSRKMQEMQDYRKTQRIVQLETELKASKAKVDELLGKLEAMKIVLDKKDAALDDITRDREKVALELKNEDLCNKYLKEQLENRLKALEKDRQKLLIQKSNFQTKKELMLGQITIEDSQQYPETLEGCSAKITSLQKYTQSLLATLLEREKTISNLCEKFLLLKFKRTQSEEQFKSLKDEYDEISSDLLEKLQDARNEINIIAETKYQDPMDKKNFALVQMVKKNGELILENSKLKLQISQLKQSINTLKLENSLIDVNTRTLEMRSVRSAHTIQQPHTRTPLNYSTKSSVNSETPYQRSINSGRTRSQSSCCTSHRSTPSNTSTYPPKRRDSPHYVTQQIDAECARSHKTPSESKLTSSKSSQTCDTDTRIDKQPRPSQSQDRIRKSRRKRKTKRCSSDSSGRESGVLSQRPVTRQLLQELHPTISVCKSNESVEPEKVRLSERQEEGISVKEEDSIESISSAMYLGPTHSTPGRVETTAFTKEDVVNYQMVPKKVVQKRRK